MANKLALETKIKKLQKNIKRKRKLIKVGVKTLRDKDEKIAQLTSLLEDRRR
jgi:hypothetical protein